MNKTNWEIAPIEDSLVGQDLIISPDIDKEEENKEAEQKVAASLRPRLTYYNIRGLAQPIRNLLNFLKVDYYDEKLNKDSEEVKKSDYLQASFNSGFPIFRDGQIRVSNSVAMSYHICNKHAKHLLGDTLQTRAKINEILFKYWMQNKKLVPFVVNLIKQTTGLHEFEKARMVCEMIRRFVSQTRFLSFCLKAHIRTNGWVLEKFSLVDFYFYEATFYFCGFFKPYIQEAADLKGLISYHKIFEGLEFLQNPEATNIKLFFKFKTVKITEIILNAWNGPQDQNII